LPQFFANLADLRLQPKGLGVDLRIFHNEPLNRRNQTMKKILMSCVALMLMSAPVLAEEAKPVPPAAEAGKDGKAPELRGRMAETDTDKDGKVSKAEFMANGEKKFAEMDKNGDGNITPDEMKAHHDAMKEKFKDRRDHKKGDAKPADAPEPPPAHQ
jgi:hypothetical protein